MSSPSVGDVWQWPDGKITILSREVIAAGGLRLQVRGRDLDFPLTRGRARTERHIVELACELYGVSE